MTDRFKVSGELEKGPGLTSITITLEKTLKWRDNWSQGDIRIITDDLASLGAVSYRTVGKQYVACRNAAGRVVASIHPGYIEFPEKFVPAELRGKSTWRLLSTFRHSSDATPGERRSNECCSKCFMWHANWCRPGSALRGAEEFGGVTGSVRGRWAQVMRVSRHWIVEVRHESDDWPRRVHWGSAEDWPGRHSSTGQPWAVELFSSLQAADIAWSWMRTGALPAGLAAIHGLT